MRVIYLVKSRKNGKCGLYSRADCIIGFMVSSIISSGHRINLLITLFQRKGFTIISVVLIVLAKIARILAKLFLDAENPMIQNTLMEDLISSRLAHVKLTCATVKRK